MEKWICRKLLKEKIFEASEAVDATGGALELVNAAADIKKQSCRELWELLLLKTEKLLEEFSLRSLFNESNNKPISDT